MVRVVGLKAKLPLLSLVMLTIWPLPALVAVVFDLRNGGHLHTSGHEPQLVRDVTRQRIVWWREEILRCVHTKAL